MTCRDLRLLFAVAVFATSCTGREDAAQVPPDSKLVWSLYRNSIIDPAMRLHIATFDSDQDSGRVTGNGLTYNGDNCETARRLFQGQEGVQVKFWCEQGRAK
jgi:hypothetical protein